MSWNNPWDRAQRFDRPMGWSGYDDYSSADQQFCPSYQQSGYSTYQDVDSRPTLINRKNIHYIPPGSDNTFYNHDRDQGRYNQQGQWREHNRHGSTRRGFKNQMAPSPQSDHLFMPTGSKSSSHVQPDISTDKEIVFQKITQGSDVLFNCKICDNKTKFPEKDLTGHLQGIDHKMAYFSAASIRQIHERKFRCDLCCFNLPTDRIRQHIKLAKHQSFVKYNADTFGNKLGHELNENELTAVFYLIYGTTDETAIKFESDELEKIGEDKKGRPIFNCKVCMLKLEFGNAKAHLNSKGHRMVVDGEPVPKRDKKTGQDNPLLNEVKREASPEPAYIHRPPKSVLPSGIDEETWLLKEKYFDQIRRGGDVVFRCKLCFLANNNKGGPYDLNHQRARSNKPNQSDIHKSDVLNHLKDYLHKRNYASVECIKKVDEGKGPEYHCTICHFKMPGSQVRLHLANILHRKFLLKQIDWKFIAVPKGDGIGLDSDDATAVSLVTSSKLQGYEDSMFEVLQDLGKDAKGAKSFNCKPCNLKIHMNMLRNHMNCRKHLQSLQALNGTGKEGTTTKVGTGSENVTGPSDQKVSPTLSCGLSKEVDKVGAGGTISLQDNTIDTDKKLKIIPDNEADSSINKNKTVEHNLQKTTGQSPTSSNTSIGSNSKPGPTKIEEPPYYCEPCNITIRVASCRSHFNGQRHLKALQKAQKKSGIDPASYDGYGVNRRKLQREGNIGGGTWRYEEKYFEKINTGYDTALRCKICFLNKEVINAADFIYHLQENSHKRYYYSAECIEKIEEGTGFDYYCKLCNVKIRENQVIIHLGLRIHKKYLKTRFDIARRKNNIKFPFLRKDMLGLDDCETTAVSLLLMACKVRSLHAFKDDDIKLLGNDPRREGNLFFCKVCDMKMNERVVGKHMNGKKHMNSVQVSRGTGTEAAWRKAATKYTTMDPAIEEKMILGLTEEEIELARSSGGMDLSSVNNKEQTGADTGEPTPESKELVRGGDTVIPKDEICSKETVEQTLLHKESNQVNVKGTIQEEIVNSNKKYAMQIGEYGINETFESTSTSKEKTGDIYKGEQTTLSDIAVLGSIDCLSSLDNESTQVKTLKRGNDGDISE